MGVARRKGDPNDALNELGLRIRICLASGSVCGIDSDGKLFFEEDIFPRHFPVLAQEIAECQRAAFLRSAELNHVDVMCVRPFQRSMKKWTDRIVRMWNVDVTQLDERFCVVMRVKGIVDERH